MQQHKGPLYIAIAEALTEAIRVGDLQEGDRLPPHRQLAAGLGVDLTTITRAFAEARRRGLVEATVGRGTFIRAGAGALRWRGDGQSIADMTMNMPPALSDPPLDRLLQEGVARLIKRQDLHVLMSYRVTGGSKEERAAGAIWLEPLLGRREPSEILVTPGAQAAMTAVLTTLTQPGDTIVAELCTYPGLRALAAQLGLVLAGIAMDAEGIRPDALDEACARFHPRLIYCNPTIQNPTTATMSTARREAILDVARRHGIMILEDDPYGLLPETAVPALAALEPRRVFYVSTLAKTISPGLRSAFLVSPSADYATRLTAALRATSLTNAGLLAGLAAQWIRGGQADQILNAIRTESAARQSLARAMLGEAPCAHPHGLHIWLHVTPQWSSAEFVGYVRNQGLALVPSEVFTVQGAPPERVRIALGAAPDRPALITSLEAIAAALQHRRIRGYEEVV
jgi:DNA-binding transcriptional MocR family regulator